MGNDPWLSKLHREEVGREIRARRRSGRPRERRNYAGSLAVLGREIGIDAARLAGALGITGRARKGKGVT